MSLHRFLPTSLSLYEDERGPLWKCAGCSLEVDDPSPQLGEECHATAMDLDGAA